MQDFYYDNEDYDDQDEFDDDDIPEDLDTKDLPPEELKRRYDILQALVYNKDRIISSQLSNLERLEDQYKNIQGQYSVLYSAFSTLSEKIKEMTKREKVMRLFLKRKEFDMQDVDEFITELKINDYYKKKKKKESDDML